MLYLNVSYEDKDKAKALGARWNPNVKKWYVKDRKDYPKFMEFMGDDNILVLDNLYLIQGFQECFRCHKQTRVIGFGLDKYLAMYKYLEVDNYKYDRQKFARDIKLCEKDNFDMHIVGPIDPIPSKLYKLIRQKYNYKNRYSKTTHTSSISNCCDYCDVLQGDFYLFYEVDSPFWIDSEEKLEKLKIYKFNLSRDILVSANDGWSSFDELFKKHCRIKEFNIEI